MWKSSGFDNVFICRYSKMKPAYWYVSMLVIAFLYIYLTAIQLVRGMQPFDDGLDLPFRYHGYEEMTAILKDISRVQNNLSALYSIGKSVQGKRRLLLRCRPTFDP